MSQKGTVVVNQLQNEINYLEKSDIEVNSHKESIKYNRLDVFKGSF